MQPGRIRCSTCGDDFQPRNILRHRKACLKRKRVAEQRAAVKWAREQAAKRVQS